MVKQTKEQKQGKAFRGGGVKPNPIHGNFGDQSNDEGEGGRAFLIEGGFGHHPNEELIRSDQGQNQKRTKNPSIGGEKV